MHFCVHQRFMVRNPVFGVLGRLMLLLSIDDGLTDSESDGSIFRRSERLRAFAELWCPCPMRTFRGSVAIAAHCHSR